MLAACVPSDSFYLELRTTQALVSLQDSDGGDRRLLISMRTPSLARERREGSKLSELPGTITD